MEEYEPHVVRGNVIYAGVDYEAILNAAENDPDGCDVILWDGGNNDFSFYTPDLMVTVVDPLRPGHEVSYYPGEVTLRTADAVVINKIDSADYSDIITVRENIRKELTRAPLLLMQQAPLLLTIYPPYAANAFWLAEDGPTLTHGEMKIGLRRCCGTTFRCSRLVDPRPYAVGKLKETFQIYRT